MNSEFKQNILLGSLTTSVLLSSVGTSMANVALPAISEDFSVGFASARWVVLSYLLSSTAFSLLVGRLGDLRGRRKILLLGTALFVIGTLTAGFAPSFSFLIFARVLQGIGGAALIVLPMALVTESMPEERTGRGIGILATMSAVGTATGPTLGGIALAHYGWQASFFFMTALGILSLFLLIQFTPRTQNLKSRNVLEDKSFRRALSSIYLNSSLKFQLVSNFAVSAVMMATLIAGPFYLSRNLHLDPARMGLIMSAGPITSVIAGILCGYVVDRIGSSYVVGIGFIQLLIGAASFAFVPGLFGPAGYVVSAVLLSVGYQLFQAANSKSVMNGVASDRRGLVSGALSLSRNLGLIVGTFVLGSVFDLFGLRETFLVAAALIAFLLVVHFKNQKGRNNGTNLITQVH